MNKWIVLLSVLLIGSLSLNLNLWLERQSNNLNKIQFSENNSTQKPLKFSSDKPLSTDSNNSNEPVIQRPEIIQSQNPSLLQEFDTSQLSREELLHQANLWLKEKNTGALATLLTTYLKQYPQDMDFLLIEAKLKVETNLLSDAIVHYYGLLRQPMTALQQSEIEQQIVKLATSTINQLKNTYSWDLLAEFVEPLLQIDPENRLYVLSLARAYAEQFQELLMENILAALPFDDPAAAAIRRIIDVQQARLEDPANDKIDEQTAIAEFGRSVKLKQFGDQFVVSAKLSNNNIDLLIDTGASITTVSRLFYKNLSNRYKRNFQGSFNVNTANGTVRAPMYQFSELVINHVKVENISIMVLPMRELENANGLLGMNFLREFDFKIDQKQALMFIE
ncbi:TIGR02281 family clan AA aspartic protease [Paraglaciecola sp.]|uniref:TIGR02281 family clan AA aspartic protease n=1 Tax=Paraglaciecola sp. TaxID=1920173 RepID=UPI003EF82B18